jgi:hypothetical protein
MWVDGRANSQERTMMMTKAMGLAMAVAMVAGSMARAQETATGSDVKVTPEIRVIPDVRITPEIKVVPDVKVMPTVNLAGLDLRVNGLRLQTNVTMNVAYQSQKDDLFAGAEKFAQGASEVTEINLDPSTMGLVGKRYGRGGDETSKMKSMSIHTYKYDKPGMFKMEDVEAYRRKLENGTWICPIRVRTQTGSSDICSRADADQVNEMVIMTIEPQKLTFIHISGKMSLDELNEMSGSANSFRPHVNLPMSPMPPTIIMTKPGAEMRIYKEPKPKAPDAPAATSPTPAPAATPPTQ